MVFARPLRGRGVSWSPAARSRVTVGSSSPSETIEQQDRQHRWSRSVARGLADYRIVEFRASQYADDLPAPESSRHGRLAT